MSYRAENGLKGNSFFRNAGLYGLSYPVEGGTTIVYGYEIWIVEGGKTTYVAMDNNRKCYYSNLKEEAYQFDQFMAKKVEEDVRGALFVNYPKAEIKIVPSSHYETIRDEY